MKFTLALLIAAVFVGCACAYSCSDESYAQYKITYNKNYADSVDNTRHFEIFCQKLKMIEEHNIRYEKGETTFKMGVNQFADMTPEEISQWLGYRNQ